MAAHTALVTVEEFLRIPEEERERKELIEGEIVEREMARSAHEIVKGTIAEHLIRRLDGDLWFVASECEFSLAGYTNAKPDVIVAQRKQVRASDPERPFAFAPQIAVEVVSSEKASVLEDRVHAFLRNGAGAVWIAYPRQRELLVRKAGGYSRYYTEGDVISDESLPGLSIPVSAFFQDLPPIS